MSSYEEFLEDFGVDVQGLEEMVRYDPIGEVWEQFGSFRCCKLSARPGEHGVFEISHSDEDHALSFLLPFDEKGALAGPGRITLENRQDAIECRVLDIEVSQDIWAELEEEIQEDLPTLTGESLPSEELCFTDHRFWVMKYSSQPTASAG